MVTDLTLPVMFTLIHERNGASFTGDSFLTYPVNMGNHLDTKDGVYLASFEYVTNENYYITEKRNSSCFLTENFATSYLLSFTLGSLVSAHVTHHIVFISKSPHFVNCNMVNFLYVNSCLV